MGALIRTGPLTHGGLESRPILADGLRRRLLQRRQAGVELY